MNKQRFFLTLVMFSSYEKDVGTLQNTNGSGKEISVNLSSVEQAPVDGM